jgi:hypothetical protein
MGVKVQFGVPDNSGTRPFVAGKTVGEYVEETAGMLGIPDAYETRIDGVKVDASAVPADGVTLQIVEKADEKGC